MFIEEKYSKIFEYIEKVLCGKNDDVSGLTVKFSFRKRSEHIFCVFIWANRLLNNEKYSKINKEAVLIASLFHDVGYAISLNAKDHAENSEIIFRNYCKKNSCIKDVDFTSFLIKNHSHKKLLQSEDTLIELILLMEADLLDEAGTMTIVWDCMAEGVKKSQSYINYEKNNSKFKNDIR